MAVVFWDRVSVLLVAFYRKGTTMTGAEYAKVLKKLADVLQGKRPEMWDDGVYVFHDNAPSHTSRLSESAINELGFIQLSHPAYSLDLVPSDYHLFPHRKKFLRKRAFTSYTQLEKSTNQWFSLQPPEFYNQGISDLPKQ